MKQFLVLGSSFFVLGWCAAFAEDEPFRPEAGKFPPVEKAHSYRGELVFVDHATRRGSIRVQGRRHFGRKTFMMTSMSTVTNGRTLPTTATTSTTRAWSVHVASELYEVARWGKGYFSVNDAGHMQVHPTKDPARAT